MMKQYLKSGDLFVWLTASGVTLSLLMVGGLLFLIMKNGLGEFWPNDIWQIQLTNGEVLIGEIMNEERIPHSESAMHPQGKQRIRLRVGNRDFFDSDFRWIDVEQIDGKARPPDLVRFERREWGPLFGRLQAVSDSEHILAEGADAWGTALQLIEQVNGIHHRIRRTETHTIGEINHELEALRLRHRSLALKGALSVNEVLEDRELQARMSVLEAEYQVARDRLDDLYRKASRYDMAVLLSDGQEATQSLATILGAIRSNELDFVSKSGLYLANLWEFVSGEPREANTEGGIFPAIFGTVMMVFIMTMVVMPFGVMAALYLSEYARQGALVRLVRIAVNNLAGVPSIVFGVFGLGFFVYAVGGTVDSLFYDEALPNPTFGTGGILWASLTLALLTVPVVIVATEEGLTAVPRDFREGSIALGATKLETLRHVILPCALPGILTGLILAMARAAGEVAPLMLTGVVKLAPALPLDSYFPFLHLDRKFMHLGFHIYDVGFQSPNVEAAKPMVFTTTLVLIVMVLTLNLVAVMIRNHLRKKYATSAV